MIRNAVGQVRRSLASPLRRNIATGVGSAVLGLLLQFVSYPIYLRYLGYQRFGVWLALSTVLTFAQLGNFGINPAVSKITAEAYGSNDMAGVKRCLNTAWVAMSLTGAVTLVAVASLRHTIPLLFGLSGGDAETMVALLPGMAAFSTYIFLVEPLNATLVGLGRMDLENYTRTLAQAIAIICSTILLARGGGIESLLLANFASYVVMNALSWAAVRRVTRSRLFEPSYCSFGDLTRMLRFGGWVFAGSILGMLVTPLNKILLSRYAGVAALPIFEIAFTSSMKVRGLLDSGLRAMMPEISRISATLGEGTGERARVLMRSGLRLIAGVGTPIYAVAMLFATPILHIWLRNQFQPALPAALRLMLVGSFLNLLCIPGYYLLLGLGKARDSFIFGIIQTVSSLATLAISLLLTGSVTVMKTLLGMTIGMGVSTLYILWKVNLLARSTKPTGLDMPPDPRANHVLISSADLP